MRRQLLHDAKFFIFSSSSGTESNTPVTTQALGSTSGARQHGSYGQVKGFLPTLVIVVSILQPMTPPASPTSLYNEDGSTATYMIVGDNNQRTIASPD